MVKIVDPKSSKVTSASSKSSNSSRKAKDVKDAGGDTASKTGKGKGKGKGKSKAKRTRSSPAVLDAPDLQYAPPPNSQRRYDSIEMALIRMELAVNHARVLADAWRRWDLKPGPGPIPPPAPPKDPMRAQLVALAEHRRRLGQAAEIASSHSAMGTTGLLAAAAAEIKKKEAEQKEKEGPVTTVVVEAPIEEEKPVTVGQEPKADPCEILHEPCRHLFTAPCRPCPEHTPGVPRDPKKVCTCTMTPREETRKDALRFLSLLPRELGATYSSMDPARIEEEKQRKKAEAKWRHRLAVQQQRFEKAMRRARALVEGQMSVPQPPFVAEHNALTFARGMSTVPVHYICEPHVCKT